MSRSLTDTELGQSKEGEERSLAGGLMGKLQPSAVNWELSHRVDGLGAKVTQPGLTSKASILGPLRGERHIKNKQTCPGTLRCSQHRRPEKSFSVPALHQSSRLHSRAAQGRRWGAGYPDPPAHPAGDARAAAGKDRLPRGGRSACRGSSLLPHPRDVLPTASQAGRARRNGTVVPFGAERISGDFFP